MYLSNRKSHANFGGNSTNRGNSGPQQHENSNNLAKVSICCHKEHVREFHCTITVNPEEPSVPQACGGEPSAS